MPHRLTLEQMAGEIRSGRLACGELAEARLRQAGAILFGKTNCPEFLANYETDNHITGRTNDPWDLGRTPGGSSGGEAAPAARMARLMPPVPQNRGS